MRMREPWTGVADLPLYRDEAEFRARDGERARVHVGRGAWRGSDAGRQTVSTWVPASLWFVAHGSAVVTSGELAFELVPGVAYAAEHGARLAIVADFARSAVCALTLPESVLARCAVLELGHAVRGPLLLPELVRDAPTLLGPLLRHARIATLPGDDAGAVPLDAIARALVHRQSVWLPELARCPGRTERHRRQLFVRLMRTRLALESGRGVGWPLARLAELANLSPTHYLRVYRRVFGHTPHEHATHMRLTEAHRRIVSSDEPVAEIGYALGFSNRCAFARAFRAYHGAAPSALRRRAHADPAARFEARLRAAPALASLAP